MALASAQVQTTGMMDRKQAIKDYKETPRAMGIFRVRNKTEGKSFVGASTDVAAMLNRQRAQLGMGAHGCRELQQDWDSRGADAFDFEILDTLEKAVNGAGGIETELRLLEDMWRDKLQAGGEELYPLRGKIR
jgi:hypothetical protein